MRNYDEELAKLEEENRKLEKEIKEIDRKKLKEKLTKEILQKQGRERMAKGYNSMEGSHLSKDAGNHSFGSSGGSPRDVHTSNIHDVLPHGQIPIRDPQLLLDTLTVFKKKSELKENLSYEDMLKSQGYKGKLVKKS